MVYGGRALTYARKDVCLRYVCPIAMYSPCQTAVILTTRLCLIVADMFLITITWRATPRRGMIPDISRTHRKGLVGVMYRDGKLVGLMYQRPVMTRYFPLVSPRAGLFRVVLPHLSLGARGGYLTSTFS